MTGFIAISMPDFLKAINHISILKYACECIYYIILIITNYFDFLKLQL